MVFRINHLFMLLLRAFAVVDPFPGYLVCRTGVLKAGDRILKINWVDISRASQQEALSVLKASEDVCTLEIEYDVTVHGEGEKGR